MKHIKMFENFDKYDFKKYTPEDGYDLFSIFNSLTLEDLPLSVIKEIQSIFPDAMHLKNGDYSYITFSLNEKFYLIYYLGDYVYYLGILDSRYSMKLIETFDDIDPLLKKLRELKNENEVS